MPEYKFIPFGDFLPDLPDYGDVALHRDINGLPLFGSYRPLRKKSVISKITDGPVTGAICHYYQNTVSVQYASPSADTSIGLFVRPEPGEGLYLAIDETNPSDADRIYSPGDADSAQVKFKLTTLESPGSATDHIMKWRYSIENATGAWTIVADLMEGDTVRHTDTVTGTGVLGWTERSHTVPSDHGIVDYANLYIRFTVTVAGDVQQCVPESDVSAGGWTRDTGSGTSLFESINEIPVSNLDYIISPALVAGGSTAAYTAEISDSLDPYTSTGYVLHYTYRATNSGVTIVVKLLQGATVIKTITHSNASTTFTTASATLSGPEADSITDHALLRLTIESSYPTSITSTAFQFQRPIADSDNNGGWLGSTGDGGPLYAEIDEEPASISDYISSNNDPALQLAAVTSVCVLQLGPATDPLTSSDHSIVIQAKYNLAGSPVFSLYQDDVFLYSWDFGGGAGIGPLTSSFVTYTLSLPGSIADQITDYSALYVTIEDLSLGGSTLVSYLTFKVPEVRKGVVSSAYLTVPSVDRAGISWFRLTIPSSSSTFQSDSVEVYAGTDHYLYRVTSAGWVNVSGSLSILAEEGGESLPILAEEGGSPILADVLEGRFAAGNLKPTSWDSVTWGESVIFTNKVDPVQIKRPDSDVFVDMIEDPDPAPKARFVTVAKDQVFLGDINLENHYSDEVWWLAVANERSATKSSITLADYQRLRQVPGQIMGLVGGEWVTVFKRNGIIRLTYVGEPQIWVPSVATPTIGTPYPKSIVRFGDDILFRGAGDFYRLSPTGSPIPIGGSLVKFLKDVDFSDEAISQIDTDDSRIEDQVVGGAVCSFSDIALWHYQGKDDLPHRHSRWVAYELSTGRWGFGKSQNDLNIAYLTSRPNHVTSESFIPKGVYGFDWDGTESGWFQFAGDYTYEIELITKIIAIDPEGRNAMVDGLRPVFTINTNLDTWPDLTITVESSNDPRMLGGVTTLTKSTTQASGDRWVGWHQSGEFWRFKVRIPELSLAMMKEFVGLHLAYRLENK